MSAPGWHPAPDRPGWLRYWSGQVWTEHYAPMPPQAPVPQVVAQQPVMQAVAAPQPKGLRCPHCGAVGRVKTKRVKTKQGISGGKAAGAVLTAGFSVLATGLSRKQDVTEMRCKACKMVWHVA
jgi:hypothetical protein